MEPEKTEAELKPNTEQQTQNQEGNTVYIGKKPITNYALVLKKLMIKDNKNEVKVEARGKLINKAINSVEMFRKRMAIKEEISIKEVKIDSEKTKNKQGKIVYVPKIEIVLSK